MVRLHGVQVVHPRRQVVPQRGALLEKRVSGKFVFFSAFFFHCFLHNSGWYVVDVSFGQFLYSILKQLLVGWEASCGCWCCGACCGPASGSACLYGWCHGVACCSVHLIHELPDLRHQTLCVHVELFFVAYSLEVSLVFI